MASHELSIEDSLGDLVAPGDVLAGKYRVEKLLGQGGMGAVVQAWHEHFEERVAVKFLLPAILNNPEAVARFDREARAAFKIKSEHVARVIDVGKLDNGAPYMVMECLEGVDLGELLATRRSLPTEEAVLHIIQACEAVAEAHALGIVHRDLKPENMFISTRTDGTSCVKVLDFGLSKVAQKSTSERRERALTSTEQVMGTPQYMSPEQWLSAKDVGPPTDQWALAVILYEMLAGTQPFERDQLAQLCTLVLQGQPAPLSTLCPHVPPAVEQAIMRALAKDPLARWPSVAEFALAIYPYGPRTARQSAKRIAGVLGVAVEEAMPASVREPLLQSGSHVRPQGYDDVPSGSALSGSALSGSALSGSALSGSALSGSALSGSALSGSALSGSALSGAALSGAALSGAALSGAAPSGAAPSGAAPSGAGVPLLESAIVGSAAGPMAPTPRRAVTAQSWNMRSSPTSSRSKAAVIAMTIGTLLTAAVLVVAAYFGGYLSGHDGATGAHEAAHVEEEPPRDDEPVTGDTATPTGEDAPATSSAATPPEMASAAPEPSEAAPSADTPHPHAPDSRHSGNAAPSVVHPVLKSGHSKRPDPLHAAP